MIKSTKRTRISIWGRQAEGYIEKYGREGIRIRAKCCGTSRGEVWNYSCPVGYRKGAGREEEWERSFAE